MCENDNLNMCLKIDDNTIYEFDEKINEQSMISSAKHIEQLLKENNAKPNKIQDIFELLIEVMQNILNYSYLNVDLENNKKEANGTFILSYDTSTDTYTLQSCNLIYEKQREPIVDKLNSIKGLDDKALRKLAREKMRSKEDMHSKGAGLGFIMMERKSSQPIEVEFLEFKDDLLQYKLKLTI